MKIYYAHPIGIYHTDQEKKDLKLIAELVIDCIIINPSDQKIADDFEQWKKTKSKSDHDMRFFKDIIKRCDGVCFRGNTQGVKYEVAKAIEFDIPTFDLTILDNNEDQ